MPLLMIRNDITKVKADAIVNAANSSLLGGGGVDGAIHRAAGPSLLDECIKLGGCPTGDAKITRAGKLDAKYVIHTVGPVWEDGLHGEEILLRSCYRKSLQLAESHNCRSIAFPVISSGIYGYPKKEALSIAKDEITQFLTNSDMLVYIVIFDSATFTLSKELYNGIRQYIDDNYASSHDDSKERVISARQKGLLPEYCSASLSLPYTLDDAINQIDESFSEMVFRIIAERGLNEVEVYKKANLDRKLFSKIRSNRTYHPKKPTAVSLAISMHLDIDETEDLLCKAGYALSRSSRFDIIVRYFIEQKHYDVNEINDALFAFDEPLLG